MERFLEPGQFVLAYNAQRLWVYFDAFEGASNDMKLGISMRPKKSLQPMPKSGAELLEDQ